MSFDVDGEYNVCPHGGVYDDRNVVGFDDGDDAIGEAYDDSVSDTDGDCDDNVGGKPMYPLSVGS